MQNEFPVIEIHPTDSLYPLSLLDLEKPPQKLYCRGDLKALSANRYIAVVGARRCQSLAVQWMNLELLTAFQSFQKQLSPPVIISGAAQGIDQQAHMLALRAGLKTIAYLPSGILKPYPSYWNEFALEFMRRGGCFISEYPDESSIRKHHFYKRNQLMVAHADQVLVIQAEKRSGSAMSGRFAMDMGKSVYVLPASPWDGFASGNLELLRCGANLLTDAQDLAIF